MEQQAVQIEDAQPKTGPSLTFFCGKMGAGKSTHAKRLAQEKNAVLLSEDECLAAFYPDQIHSIADYLKYSALIKPFIKSHVQRILGAGTQVVMDFPANTAAQRRWFLALCREVGCDSELVYLNLTDEQCLAQIAKRRIEQPQRAQFDTEAMFYQISQYFEPPSAEEGLRIITC
ncbi:AAA family ATPase [Shewanella sedimentimangrovi]|uniref:ATP-binding protein n=1 Tax=Shewanella sedimentimangrovi TaxID=2814293 RepID=A0ABX7QYP5_9GAMM|nr:ATP-binding protein [Shewanella sedimentimangrovi]QSX36564.1 ATP-binding protein [Shewanella sedimentimangrovi]